MTIRVRKRTLPLLAAASALLVGAAGTAASAEPVGAQLARLRQATVQYLDVEAAIADGYSGDGFCVPNMGYHFHRDAPSTGPHDLDPLTPEVLVYAPRPNGTLRLVAVEYASVVPASLYGVDFDPPAPPGVPGPPFSTLHAWIWQGNPNGTFAAFNPNIHCP